MASYQRPFLIAAAALLAALTGGCGSGGDSQTSVVVIGEPGDPFEKGIYLSPAGQLVRASVAEGLVAFDEQGRVVPALADRWIVTDDGQSYIFRMREGTWHNGEELTARTAAQSLRKALAALRGTSLGLDLAGVEEVREMAGRVIEIRLSSPAPYLLQLLAQPELGLLHDGEGAGPMRLERIEGRAQLTPIPPEERGLPGIMDWEERARTISLSAAGGVEAVARFNAGEANVVLGGTIATFPLTASVGILRGTIQLDPVEGLFGLQVASTRGFLADPANREALAMAVDRDALIAPFRVDGWKTATGILPAALERELDAGRGMRWDGLAIEDRRALAAARVSAWRQGQGADGQAPSLGIWLPPGPGSDLVYSRIRQDFASIGITLVRTGKEADANLRLLDATARYPNAMWYLNRLGCRPGRNACSPEADRALAAARKAADPAERDALIAEAERLLNEANLFIAFGSPIRWSLVRGDTVGFATNAWGWHPLMPMALLPK
jgi:ABC-type transport system substrate-binding protein